jgi:hypothetical protein
VEKDPRSPGGKGYSGFEALLQYVYDQTMAINAFDSNGYMLKVNLFLSECSEYQSLASLKEKMRKDPGFYSRCASILGPNQPGITQPDPSYTGAQERAAGHHLPVAAERKEERRPPQAPQPPQPPPAAPPTPPAVDDRRLGDEVRRRVRDRTRETVKKIQKRLEDTLGIELPELPPAPGVPPPELPPAIENLPQPQTELPDTGPLLDFLLRP